MKRIIDLVFSSVVLILISPILLMLGMLIFLTMGRPIFFVQKRPGINGKPFNFYKFRTMNNNINEHGQLLPDYQRVTKLGSFMRKMSLDELPSFLNVLIGNMSLVGPRPLLMEYLKLYTPLEARRHDIKPGITGWAQINGRNSISWAKKFKLDIWYLDNRSLFLDFKILILTILKILKSDGINQSENITMEKFNGKN